MEAMEAYTRLSARVKDDTPDQIAVVSTRPPAHLMEGLHLPSRSTDSNRQFLSSAPVEELLIMDQSSRADAEGYDIPSPGRIPGVPVHGTREIRS